MLVPLLVIAIIFAIVGAFTAAEVFLVLALLLVVAAVLL